MRHPGGGVQQALDMNQQGLTFGCVCESHHHRDGGGGPGCERVSLEYCRV